MGTTAVYNRGKFILSKGTKPPDISDVRVLLVNSLYVFNAAHNTVADITNELVGTGYVRKALTNKTLVEDDIAGIVKFDADDLTWLGSNFGTPDAAIVFYEAAADAGRELICCFDINPKLATAGTDFTLQWGANGVFVLQ